MYLSKFHIIDLSYVPLLEYNCDIKKLSRTLWVHEYFKLILKLLYLFYDNFFLKSLIDVLHMRLGCV